MTLDEARRTLGVTRSAGVSEIRDAFRRRAREVHPDRHPSADDATRARLGREFDDARRARDMLIAFEADAARAAKDASHRAPRPQTSTPSSPPRTASTAPPTRERARPRTSESRSRPTAPRVTVRFDDFVRASDAAGFGPGTRTRRWVDWPRVIAWSVVGTLFVAIFGGGAAVAALT